MKDFLKINNRHVYHLPKGSVSLKYMEDYTGKPDKTRMVLKISGETLLLDMNLMAKPPQIKVYRRVEGKPPDWKPVRP